MGGGMALFDPGDSVLLHLTRTVAGHASGMGTCQTGEDRVTPGSVGGTFGEIDLVAPWIRAQSSFQPSSKSPPGMVTAGHLLLCRHVDPHGSTLH